VLGALAGCTRTLTGILCVPPRCVPQHANCALAPAVRDAEAVRPGAHRRLRRCGTVLPACSRGLPECCCAIIFAAAAASQPACLPAATEQQHFPDSPGPAPAPAGGGVAEARHQGLVTLVHRCRRFFPTGSAAEIWEQFSPALADPQRPECFEVRPPAGPAAAAGAAAVEQGSSRRQQLRSLCAALLQLQHCYASSCHDRAGG
jgi:hypothetical protein